eukprot:5100815-Pyramimonas_sp.AAC.1
MIKEIDLPGAQARDGAPLPLQKSLHGYTCTQDERLWGVECILAVIGTGSNITCTRDPSTAFRLPAARSRSSAA